MKNIRWLMETMARSRFSPNIWPGFVDMLSALVTVLLFSFMIFIVTHFYFQGLIQTRNKSLLDMKKQLISLQRSVYNEKKEHALTQTILVDIEKEKEIALKQKKEAILQKEALENSQHFEKKQLQAYILDLKDQLEDKTMALKGAQEELAVLSKKQLNELRDYRSEFFGRLKKALSDRKDVRITGDRFLFQSEVLFELGSAAIGEKGKQELKAFAHALKTVMTTLPKDIGWVLRVDGHTDRLPLKSDSFFSSNLELSIARALSVVRFLIEEGIPADRLVAAGFGQHHPVSSQNPGPQNRRIELTLDQKQKTAP